MALKVCEIFYSIQGESTWAGQPCVFIRLTGCNLRCAYCDTSYAYEQGAFMEIAEILERVREARCSLVEVTGGEPLIQPETPLLISALLDDGRRVLLETNGSVDIGAVDPRCVRIVDIKCPSSGMSGKNDLRNMEKLAPHDELKFVIANHGDYRFARDFLTNFPALSCPMNFSPAFGVLDPRTLAEWILQDCLPVRLNLQLHKIVKMP
ncbi:MAG TPA: radical SAM protein [Syntrophobacteraceae bacterium]|nr:radical SAM protein [Syntrophobacteraceae bacterium]